MYKVTLSEWLRPWASLGVGFFLADGVVDLSIAQHKGAFPHLRQSPGALLHQNSAALQAKEHQSTSHLQHQGSQIPSSTHPVSQVDISHASLSAHVPPHIDQKDFQSAVSHPTIHALDATIPQAGQQAVTIRQDGVGQKKVEQAIPNIRVQQKDIPMAEWPPFFVSIFKKLSPAPVLWSYKDLGYDLSGQANPGRSACLRTIITQLNLPKGTSVFWPFSVPEKDTLRVESDIFLQGVRELSPRAILMLGSSSLDVFGEAITSRTSFTHNIYEGRLVLVLPDLEELIANEALIKSSVDFLRSTLTSFAVIKR